MKYNLSCTKCSEKYKTDDIDPYLCSTCKDAHLEMAKKIDKEIASRPPKRPQVSALQQFDAIAKAKGGGAHVSIADLGKSPCNTSNLIHSR